MATANSMTKKKRPKKKPLPSPVPKDAIKQYIAERFYAEMQEGLEEVMCDHTWNKYGHGYQCDRCEYYTGDNSDLNSLIEKYLATLVKEIKFSSSKPRNKK